MAEPFAVSAEEQHNNDLFDRLPFLADALLPLCDACDVLAVSAACQSWRRAVQLGQLSLAPRSELAMPFVADCLHLRHLQLSHTLPAASHGMALSKHLHQNMLPRSFGCGQLQLQLSTSHCLSASPVRSASLPTGPHSDSLLAHVGHLVHLTQLDLACSQTRAWRGQAVQVTAEDLAHLTGCTALQVCQQLSTYLRPSVN